MAFGKLVQAGLLTGLLVSSAAHAQNALRAPLNIVPPVMQTAIGNPKTADRKSEKLAPRTTARQMKRAVRAVAPAPGSAADIVQVGQLGTLQDAPVGLEIGFARDLEKGEAPGLWRGARLAFIADQMARLPTRFTASALRDAELTLHRGTAAAPVGTVDGISWFGARLNRFLALGDTQAVLALEALTGAAASDAYAARATVLAHLGTGNPEAACEVTRPQRSTLGRRDNLRFFLQLGIYCQLRAKEFEKVSLTMDLNQKTLGTDKLFRDMAFLLAAQVPLTFGTSEEAAAAKKAKEEPPLVLPSELTPLQIALLQLAGEPLPASLPSVPPYYGGALASDYSQAAQLQLAVAHRAVLAGRMPAEQFSQVSQLADLSGFAALRANDVATAETPEEETREAETPEDLTPEGGGIEEALAEAEADIPSVPDAIYLAQVLLAVDATASQNQAQFVAQALRQASARGLWRDLVLLLDDRLRDLPIPLDDVSLEAAQTLEAVVDDPLADPLNDPFNDPFNETRLVALAPEFVADADIAVLLPALRYVGQFEKAEALAGTQVSGRLVERLLSFLRPAAEALLPVQAPVLEPVPELYLSDTPFTDVDNQPAVEAELAEDAAPVAEASVAQLLDAMQPLQPSEPARETSVEPSLPPELDWAAWELEWAGADVAHRKFLRRELAIYHGLGTQLPSALEEILGLSALDSEQLRLKKLADNKWIGDFLIAVVASYGEVQPNDLQTREVVLLLKSLRHIGLSSVADDLARELFTRASARLSVTSPQAFGAQALRPVLFSPDEAAPPNG